LSVSITGSGTVSSNPSGISSCTSSCMADFQDGSMVMLTATPSIGSRFTGWTGACSGSVRTNCTVTMNAARSVTASFVTYTNNIVFVSSATYNGNLGGVLGADANCNQLATAAGLNNATNDAYIAWLSQVSGTGTGDVLTRLGTARGFIRVDGAPFADQLQKDVANPIYNAIDRDENGSVLHADVWTAETSTLHPGSADDCGAWASTAGSGWNGSSAGGPSAWTNGGTFPHPACSAPQHLYCFMKTKTSALSIAPQPGKVTYVTALGTLSGVAGANSACTTSKPLNAGTVVALLPLFGPPARSASSLLSAASTYVRPDGIVVGTGAEIAAGNLRSGIWQSGNGLYGARIFEFTGTSSISATPASIADTCSDWTVTTGSVVGADGRYVSNWWGGSSS